MHIWPLGAPVRAQGSGFVIELPDKSTQLKLSVAVQCDVPAVGSRVAQIFANQMIRALEQDHNFTFGYLRQMAKTTLQDPIAAK